MTRVLPMVRWLGAVVATAIVAGLIAGLAARLAMRAGALTDAEPVRSTRRSRSTSLDPM